MESVLGVVVNWRSAPMTLRAVAALRAAMAGVEGAITVVDNASGDGSAARLGRLFRRLGWERGAAPVCLRPAGRNGGYGAGNNLAIRAGLPGGAPPDFVFILNPDAFPEPGAIHALLRHMADHPRCGIAGSAIRGPDGALHETAFRFPTILGEFESHARLGPLSRLLRRHVRTLPLSAETMDADWVSGAAVMLRRKMLDEIGLFDEGFFLYFEETDLCHRARAAGWRCAYVPTSRVTHIGSASTGMKHWSHLPAYWLDSRLRYFSKAGGRAHALAATLAALAGGALWRLRCRLEGRALRDPPHYLGDLWRHHLRHGFYLGDKR